MAVYGRRRVGKTFLVRNVFEDAFNFQLSGVAKVDLGGVYAEISTWRSGKAGQGAQIDLLIDRKDRVINICEMKYSVKPFAISKSYAENLRNKLMVFRTEIGTKKTLFLTIITANGLAVNEYSQQLVQDALDMNALFG